MIASDVQIGALFRVLFTPWSGSAVKPVVEIEITVGNLLMVALISVHKSQLTVVLRNHTDARYLCIVKISKREQYAKFRLFIGVRGNTWKPYPARHLD